MTKFDLVEASQRMAKAINEICKVADLLQDDSEYFSSTVKQINKQIDDMTRAANLINQYAKRKEEYAEQGNNYHEYSV